MSRSRFITFALLLAACKSEPARIASFDSQAAALQEELNDQSFRYYQDKHRPELIGTIRLENLPRSTEVIHLSEFVYELKIDEDGRAAFRAIRPPPDIYAQSVQNLLAGLRFKPAWIGPKNFATTLRLRLIVVPESY